VFTGPPNKPDPVQTSGSEPAKKKKHVKRAKKSKPAASAAAK